jgi:hypothetical protein
MPNPETQRRAAARRARQEGTFPFIAQVLVAFSTFWRWGEDKAVCRLARYVDSLLDPNNSACQLVKQGLPRYDESTTREEYRRLVEDWQKRKSQACRDHTRAQFMRRVNHSSEHKSKKAWEFLGRYNVWQTYDRHSQWRIQDALSKGDKTVIIFAQGTYYVIDIVRGEQSRFGSRFAVRPCRESDSKLYSKWRNWQNVNDEQMPYVVTQGKLQMVLPSQKSMYSEYLQAFEPWSMVPKVCQFIDVDQVNRLTKVLADQFPSHAGFFRPTSKLQKEVVNGTAINMALDEVDDPSIYDAYVRSTHSSETVLDFQKWVRIVSPESLERFADYARTGAHAGVTLHITFHGCSRPESLGSIAKDGLNPWYCVDRNNLYGYGAYVATNADYSTHNGYCCKSPMELGGQGIALFVCATLVRRSVIGTSNDRILPLCRDGNRADTFRNAAGNIYAIQNPAQVLPLGLLMLRRP